MCNILTWCHFKAGKCKQPEKNEELKTILTKKSLLMFCNVETVYKCHLHVSSGKVYSPSLTPLRNSKEQIYIEI